VTRVGSARVGPAVGAPGKGIVSSPVPSSELNVVVSDDVAAIVRRAATLGIPAWRVTVALGLWPATPPQENGSR
jgi:hypothetical protein